MSPFLSLLPRTEECGQRFRGSGRWSVPDDTAGRLESRQFAAMDRAFRAGGGIIPGDELVHRMRCRHRQPISRLARWIVDHEVISFDWHAATMLPLFQFYLSGMTVRSPVAAVLRELNDVFDGWELALWFAQPNGWLDGHAPVDRLGVDPDAVHEAARADRFIARS